MAVSPMWALPKGFKNIFQICIILGALLSVLCISSHDNWYKAGIISQMCWQTPRRQRSPQLGPREPVARATGLPRPYANSKDGSWWLGLRFQRQKSAPGLSRPLHFTPKSEVSWLITSVWQLEGSFLCFSFFLSLCFPLASLLCKKSPLHHSPSLPLYS